MTMSLGARMKELYEEPARVTLPEYETLIIRLDGRAFHTYTRGTDKPFDARIVYAMNTVARKVAAEVSSCALAYAQSDEVSLVVRPSAEHWFGGDTQKIASVTAAVATVAFNDAMGTDLTVRRATFDSRCFTIASHGEVLNYLVWRQQDAIRNSVSSIAQTLASHSELHGIGREGQLQLIEQSGRPWESYDLALRQGALTTLETHLEDIEYVAKDTGELVTVHDVQRSRWTTKAAPLFGDTRTEVSKLIWSAEEDS